MVILSTRIFGLQSLFKGPDQGYELEVFCRLSSGLSNVDHEMTADPGVERLVAGAT